MPKLRKNDEGFSLVELTISMTIFGMLMALVMSVFISAMNQQSDARARAETAEQARLAVAQLDSQIRSGSVIQDPDNETLTMSGVNPGFSVRILTERNGVQTCAQWRVVFDGNGEGKLQFRSWPAWTPASVTAWTQVASGIMAPEGTYVAGDERTYSPFVLQTPVTGESVIKTLIITLRVKAPGTRDDAKNTLVQTAVTGRNTIFGQGGLECSNVPAP